MARTRRKRLYVRQSLAYREGKSNNASWSVGYWDGPHPYLFSPRPDDAFRVITNKPTEPEAAEAAKELARQRSKEYIYG